MQLLVAIIFGLLYFSKASSIVNTTDQRKQMFSRKIGLQYDVNQMRHGSLITALYSIPCVQKVLYEEYRKEREIVDLTDSTDKADLTTYLVDTFVMMRSESINSNLVSVKKLDEFPLIHHQWNQILNNLPGSVNNLFKFIRRFEVIKLSNLKSAFHSVEERLYQGLFLNSNFTSVSQYIEEHFSDEMTNKLVYEKFKSKSKAVFPLKVVYSVVSHPEVFTVVLDRFKNASDINDFCANNTPFKVDQEIILNSTNYILISRVAIDSDLGYYTIALDLGDSKYYRYDANGNVSEYVETKELDTDSVILFYIPKASASKLNFDELRNLQDVQTFLKPETVSTTGTKRSFDKIDEYIGDFNDKTLPQQQEREVQQVRLLEPKVILQEGQMQCEDLIQLDQNRKQEEELQKEELIQEKEQEQHRSDVEPMQQEHSEEEQTQQIPEPQKQLPFTLYKPDFSLYPQYFEVLKSIERNINEGIGICPNEILDFYAKFNYKVYPLGSEQYSFKPSLNGQPYHVLELFLMCLASNSKVVFKLFEFAETENNIHSFEYNLATVIVRMLMGCQNISLEKLITAYTNCYGKSFNFTIDLDAKDSGLREAFKRLLSWTSFSLIGIPKVNVVTYFGLDSDDPIKISAENESGPIELDNLIEPGEAKIKGIWYDSMEYLFYRRRKIYKPITEIAVIEVERWTECKNEKTFQSTELKLNSEDYEQVGVITLGADSSNFDSYFIDSFTGSNTFRYLVPGMESISYEMSESKQEYFEKISKNESVLLFFTKKSSETPKRFSSSFIPKNLFRSAISDLANELNFKMNK